MLTDFTPAPDEIDLPPLLIGGAHAYYRRAKPRSNHTAFAADGGLLITLRVQVVPYSDEACTQPWPASKWPAPVTIATDELTAVDPDTGAIRFIYRGLNGIVDMATGGPIALPATPDYTFRQWVIDHPDWLTLQTHYYRRRYDAGTVDMKAEEVHHIQQAAAWGLLD